VTKHPTWNAWIAQENIAMHISRTTVVGVHVRPASPAAPRLPSAIKPRSAGLDVLQRIDSHPAKDVALLTPRLWKEHFAGDPPRSDIDRVPVARQR
jgi:hypothetical protein